MNWNTGLESNDEKANRLARDETLKWLEYRLRPHTLTPMPDLNNPGGYVVNWMGRPQLRYRMMTGTNLINWTQQGAEVIGQGNALSATVTIPEPEDRIFHQLDYDPMPAPVNDVLYSSFFLEYADFSY